MTLLSLKSSLSQRLKQLPQSFYLKNNLIRKKRNRLRDETQSPSIRLYDAENIEACLWPENDEGRYAQRFLAPLIKRGVSSYIENVKTDLRALVWDQLVFPITINDAQYDNAYVCSPYSYYISYARESLSFITQSWIFHGINALLWGASKVLRHYQVNKVVTVNNWLYSTNLYPALQPEQITAIAQFLQIQFPDYAIVFRSIDAQTSRVCHQTLHSIGFDYIASRQIFYIDPHQSTLFDSRLFKSDLKLLKNSGYEIIEGDQIPEEDFPRVVELYRDLYIHKYSDLNPKFNVDFLRLSIRQNLMHFKALRKNGRIDGIIGYVQRNGMMICPFFGYDRTLPKEIALYRLLSTILMLDAYDRHLLFHQSSGASTFKKIRKAESCIEYMAVLYHHLNLRRRIPWWILKKMCNSIGILYMKRY